MVTLELHDRALEKKLSDLLRDEFGGDADKMVQQLLESYAAALERLRFSGILTWETDALAYQKELRGEWQ